MIAILALVLALLGTVIGGLALAWALSPGPSGEWAALATPAAFFACTPAGLLGLLVGRLAAPSRLRRASQVASLAALFLPTIVWLVQHR